MARKKKTTASVEVEENKILLITDQRDTETVIPPDPEHVADPIAEAIVAATIIEEEVVAVLEAKEGEPVIAPIAIETQDFDAALKAVPEADVEAKLDATVKAIKERQDFELVKDASNAKIQKTLDSVHKQVCTKRAARLMCAVNLDPTILNRVIHEGARYNVYAMGKLGDAIWGLTNDDAGQKGAIRNAINLACGKSLFRFRAAGVQFTGEMAKAAASDKFKVDAKVKDHLVRHTVSTSTAPTQASSTMQALESLGIVKRSGSGKNPNFDLTANPIVERLRETLAA